MMYIRILACPVGFSMTIESKLTKRQYVPHVRYAMFSQEQESS